MLAVAALVYADEEPPAASGGVASAPAAPLCGARGGGRSPPSDARGGAPSPPAAARGGKGGKRAGRPDPEAMIGLLKAYKEANVHVNARSTTRRSWRPGEARAVRAVARGGSQERGEGEA